MNTTPFMRRLSWVLLLAISFLLGNCGNKDNITPDSVSIQGSWRLTGYTVDPAFDLLGTGTKITDILEAFKQFTGGPEFVDCYKSIVLTFGTDGKITGTVSTACSGVDASPFGNAATWTQAGSKVKITDGSDIQEYDVTISGTTLKLSQTLVDDFDQDGRTETETISYLMTKV